MMVRMPPRDLALVATWVSRCAVALVAVGAVVGAAVTTTMVRTLWSPTPPGSIEAYSTALLLHGSVLSAVFSPAAALAVVVPLVLPTARRPGVPLALAAVGFAAWITAAAIGIAVADTGWEFASMPDPWPVRGAWCTVLAHAAFAAALAAAAIGALRTEAVGVLATLAAAAIAVGVLAGFGAATLAAAEPASAPMVVATVHDATLLWGVIVAVVIAVVGLTRLEPARVASPGLVFVALGVLPALLGERLLMRLVALVDLDVHLHDTYFEVARGHMASFAAGAAMFAVLHVFEARVFGRHARAALAWPGAVLGCGGFLAHHGAMMVLGTRGMPRRYAVYPEVFTDLQQIAQGAGAVAAVGLLLAAAAWLVGKRPVTAA